jgi:DNA-binding PadR family transcriptional regulator
MMSNLSPEYALLGFLAAGASHGYELHQRFTAELGHVWHMSQSQAYAILNRLERRGDISSRLIEQSKLPARQKLRITTQGRCRFMEWLESGTSSNARAVRLEFLSRLFFAKMYKPEIIFRIYKAQCAETLASIQHLESLLAQLPNEQTFNRLSLDLRLRQMKLIMAWMEELKPKIPIPAKEIS